MFQFEHYLDKINKICNKHQVKSLVVFGSALSENFNSTSDIDLLIELIDTNNGMIRYMKIKFELETLFSRPVDLVMPKAIKNKRIKPYILANTKQIYVA